MYLLIIVVILTVTVSAVYSNEDNSTDDWPCSHPVFCNNTQGSLLHKVQMASLFQDSKTFVDMPMKFTSEEVLANFGNLTDHDSVSLKSFVTANFDEAGEELESLNPSDWIENPGYFSEIVDDQFRNLALTMNVIWKNLTRQFKQNSDDVELKSSLIYLPNPFVVPGGRFREVYYWDSYWTLKGLMLCGMFSTSKGMLDNFNMLVKRFGHIPNANRVYYSRRSQPPMFAMMVSDYLDMTNDLSSRRAVISEFIWQLDREFQFWKKRMIDIKIGHKVYNLARYKVEGDGPRPESYWEDITESEKLPEDQRKEWFMNMKSGAESGWDYSSRWFVNNTNSQPSDPLLTVKTTDIIPIDLNSFLCKTAQIISRLFELVEVKEKMEEYRNITRSLKESIRGVLYDETKGLWYDFNLLENNLNKNIFLSNLSPLYTECYHDDIDMNRTVEALLSGMKDIFSEAGGVPASLVKSSQQWDYPNVWPPLVEMTVVALENTGIQAAKQMAREVSQKFLQNVLTSHLQTGHIFEKYDCGTIGKPGSGGEYHVQDGFGWTNGVSLSLLARYPDLSSSSLRLLYPSVLCFVLLFSLLFML